MSNNLYTPHPEESEIFAWHQHLHNLPPIYKEAHNLLLNINQHLTVTHIVTLKTTTDPRAYAIDDINLPGRCYCPQFQHEPELQPHGLLPLGLSNRLNRGWKYEPACLHTITWRAYREILLHHWQTARISIRYLHQHERWLRGRYELPSKHLLAFSTILAVQKGQHANSN